MPLAGMGRAEPASPVLEPGRAARGGNAALYQPVDEAGAYGQAGMATEWRRLARRPAQPLAIVWPPLQPLTRADSLPPLPRPLVRRWAVQLLAGPALTYRQLGSAAELPVPTTYSYNSDNRKISTDANVRNEKAATVGGAEIQLRRVLNGRWALSTGLGYHPYASTQAVTVVTQPLPVTSLPGQRPATTVTYAVRDTWHFLTVPLRLSYQLGTGSPRLRYGLLAGAEGAWYLGGQSAEGSDCGCTSRRWGVAGSPYRAFSLALNAGAEVRWQLAPRWELLAQPLATYFLQSIVTPASTTSGPPSLTRTAGTGFYTNRQPLGATVLLGVSHWLR